MLDLMRGVTLGPTALLQSGTGTGGTSVRQLAMVARRTLYPMLTLKAFALLVVLESVVLEVRASGPGRCMSATAASRSASAGASTAWALYPSSMWQCVVRFVGNRPIDVNDECVEATTVVRARAGLLGAGVAAVGNRPIDENDECVEATTVVRARVGLLGAGVAAAAVAASAPSPSAAAP